jgi:hypothetical protein
MDKRSDWLKLFEKVEKFVLDNLIYYLKTFIYPFATCFFAIINYSKMSDVFKKNQHPYWNVFAFLLSVVYVLFTLGFGAYLLYIDKWRK